MVLYIFDTDTCSYVMKRMFPSLLNRVRATPPAEQAVSVVSVAELLYGACLSTRPREARIAFDAFIRYLAVLDWTREAAEHYVDIRADLKVRGNMIGANDLLIAAQSRSMGAVLVTNNVGEFERVPGLKVENWTR